MKNGLHAGERERGNGCADVETAIDFFSLSFGLPTVGWGWCRCNASFFKRETLEMRCPMHTFDFSCIHLFTLHTISNGFSGKDMKGAKRMWIQHTPKYAYFYCDSVNLNRCVYKSLSLSLSMHRLKCTRTYTFK